MAPALTSFELPPQPLWGTDVASYVLALLALLYTRQATRDREPGMLALAGSMALFAFWWATSRWHLPSGPTISQPQWLLLPAVAMVLLQLGLVRYLGVPARTRRWLVPLLLLFPCLGVVTVTAAFFVTLPRMGASPTLTMGFMATGLMALWSARRDAGAGHGAIGLSLVSVPVFSGMLMLTGVDIVYIRYLAVLPLLLFGLVLLSVSLRRRHRALQAEVQRRASAEAELARVNLSLETTVARRTADLQDMVAGLEGFTRNVSHDLRGPLGGIAGVARLAEEALQRGETDTAARMLAAIAAQADSATQLVTALLALARVSDAPLHPEAVNLTALAQEVAQALPAPQGAIEIDPLPTVQADATLLRAVLANLLGNAVKFTRQREGGAHIHVSAEVTPQVVTVSVQDNGAGFDNARAQRLFQPFQRLHGAEVEGHGVGLSIVRRAVERMGGAVSAQGQPGQGATFRFSLPRALA